MRTSARLTAAALAALSAVFVAPAAAAASTSSTETYVAVVEEADGSLAVSEFEASTAAQVRSRVEDLDETGDVVSVDIDRPVRALGDPDPLRIKQWALNQTSFESAWPLTNGAGAVVAVLDTGVQADHEDLAGVVLSGWDAIANAPGGRTDPDGHGTHVAGIVAAATSNGKGISGSAPGVRILPVRVLDENGSGRLSDILEGIIWAADHGADVINLSLGGGGNATTYAEAIRYATNKGALIVAAAGNEAQNGNAPSYPAADAGAIAVASTTSAGTRSAFSNYGSYVDIAAPGSAIQSTIPSGYASWSGTSMATPYAAAAAALLAARHPDLSPSRIRSLIEGAAIDLGAAGRDDEFGAGLIDPYRALTLAAPAPAPVPVSPVTNPVPTPTPSTPVPVAPPATARGYWVVTADGRVQAFGSAPNLGDATGTRLNAPIVASAGTPSGRGYWLAGADGAVFAFGDAAYLGSAQALGLKAPIVGIAATPSGKGYWLLGRDGGVFTFGDAAFFGSTGAMSLNQPVVDMAPTPTGRGYWLVAGDGGVFTFGDATFRGSTGGIRLNRPVVSITPAANGGYWMVAADGGIFAFDVPFHGSLPGLAQAGLPGGQRIRATAGGAGYYILGTDGRVFAFGTARDMGSAAGSPAADLVLAV